MTKNRETGRIVTDNGVELDAERLKRVELYKAGTTSNGKQSQAWRNGFLFGKGKKNGN